MENRSAKSTNHGAGTTHNRQRVWCPCLPSARRRHGATSAYASAVRPLRQRAPAPSTPTALSLVPSRQSRARAGATWEMHPPWRPGLGKPEPDCRSAIAGPGAGGRTRHRPLCPTPLAPAKLWSPIAKAPAPTEDNGSTSRRCLLPSLSSPARPGRGSGLATIEGQTPVCESSPHAA